MEDKEVLYHGSPNPLVGDKLRLSQGKDDPIRPENNEFGVYATSRKDLAIVMAIFGCKDCLGGSIDEYENNKLNATIYGDFPKQEYVYVHHLQKDAFKQLKIDPMQYVSLVAVKPIKTEKVKIQDYKHLLKVATEKQTQLWLKKYKDM